jgi:hypothetical protein
MQAESVPVWLDACGGYCVASLPLLQRPRRVGAGGQSAGDRRHPEFPNVRPRSLRVRVCLGGTRYASLFSAPAGGLCEPSNHRPIRSQLTKQEGRVRTYLYLGLPSLRLVRSSKRLLESHALGLAARLSILVQSGRFSSNGLDCGLKAVAVFKLVTARLLAPLMVSGGWTRSQLIDSTIGQPGRVTRDHREQASSTPNAKNVPYLFCCRKAPGKQQAEPSPILLMRRLVIV